MSWGAAAMALSEGCGVLSAGLSVFGVGETVLSVAGVASATWSFDPPSSPPLTAVKPTKPTTATIAATMAAVQFGPRRSGRMRSASNRGAVGVGAGRPPWVASNRSISAAGSRWTALARVLMCPRA